MKARNNAFDLLCGLCILRMLLLHTISVCGYRSEYWFGRVMAWTFFFLCFFFFKAGYFNKGVSGPTIPYLKDRVKRLLVPYLTWGIIGSFVFFGLIYFFPEPLKVFSDRLRDEHVWQVSHFYGNPPVWFLFSFFCMYVCVHFIQKVPWLSVLVIAFPFVSWWLAQEKNPLWLSLNNVFMGIFFFYLGHWWHWLQNRIPARYFVAVSALLVLEFLLGNHFWHGEYDMSLNKWVQHPAGAVINITCALCGLSGLLLSIRVPRIPILCFMGEHSMVYFVLHYPIIHYVNMVRVIGKHSICHHWNDFILLFLIVILLCSWAVPYIERVPWLSGRWPNAKKSMKPEVVSETETA